MLISTQMCAWLNMRIVIVHDQVICLFDSVLFVRLYVLPLSRESESGRYKRAEYERPGQSCTSCWEVNMCNQEEEVSEHLVTKRLESKEEILEAEDKYQWAIVQLKLMSVEQKLMVLEAMEQQMSPEEWVSSRRSATVPRHPGGDHGPEEGGRAPEERS